MLVMVLTNRHWYEQPRPFRLSCSSPRSLPPIPSHLFCLTERNIDRFVFTGTFMRSLVSKAQCIPLNSWDLVNMTCWCGRKAERASERSCFLREIYHC